MDTITKYRTAIVWLGVAVLGLLATLVVMLIPATHHTPETLTMGSTQDRADFVQYMRTGTYSFAGESDDQLLAQAAYVCSGYFNDQSTADIAAEFLSAHGPEETGTLIGAATGTFCPQIHPEDH